MMHTSKEEEKMVEEALSEIKRVLKPYTIYRRKFGRGTVQGYIK